MLFAFAGFLPSTATVTSTGLVRGDVLRELSMVPGALGEVKDLLARHDVATLRAAADAVRAARSATEARTALTTALT
jgi:phosphoenolpyruvate-protein kinase (PTS system EI component)